MRVVAYLRVSTLGQARDGYGLLAQEDAYRAFASVHHHDLHALPGEEGVRGSRAASDQPAMTEALALLQSGDADARLVACLDRLAPTLTVPEAAIATVWRLGGRVLAAEAGDVRRTTPTTPCVPPRGRWPACSPSWTTASSSSARATDGVPRHPRGGKANGCYPFGTSRSGPVEREQAVLDRVRALRLDGATWQQVTDDLNRRLPAFAPRRAPRWTRQVVQRLPVRPRG